MRSLPQEGDVLKNRYTVEQKIGRGGFAMVFRAWDREQRRPVALKVILPEALNNKQVGRRLTREARLAGCLTHPNTICIYESGVLGEGDEEGLPYISMELLSGESLGIKLRREGTLSSREVTHILLEVLASLAEAHEKGIIHRDLKPDNIFLCNGKQAGRVKVLDFGIARAVGGDWGQETMERLTRTGVLPGTAAYMAPEFFNGAPQITAAADVYALGCMAYKLLTGEPPFRASTPTAVALKHIKEPPPPLPSEVDPNLARVIERSLLKAVSLRYPNAGAMLADLRGAAEGVRGRPMLLDRPEPAMAAVHEPTLLAQPVDLQALVPSSESSLPGPTLEATPLTSREIVKPKSAPPEPAPTVQSMVALKFPPIRQPTPANPPARQPTPANTPARQPTPANPPARQPTPANPPAPVRQPTPAPPDKPRFDPEATVRLGLTPTQPEASPSDAPEGHVPLWTIWFGIGIIGVALLGVAWLIAHTFL